MRFSSKIYLYRGRVNDSFSLDSIALPILCVSVHITTFITGVPIRVETYLIFIVKTNAIPGISNENFFYFFLLLISNLTKKNGKNIMEPP